MLLITVKHVVMTVIIGSPTLTYHLNELLYTVSIEQNNKVTATMKYKTKYNSTYKA